MLLYTVFDICVGSIGHYSTVAFMQKCNTGAVIVLLLLLLIAVAIAAVGVNDGGCM